MATYRYTNTGANGLSLMVTDRPVYGSSRLGSLRQGIEMLDPFDPLAANPIQQVDLNYELTDHLGNVCAVVTGRLLDGNGGGTPKQAELVSAQGYEPFGSLLPGRNYSSDSYRFGFNGMPKDDEVHGSTGTSYDFGARLYDPRIGRWLSLDPVGRKYPEISPYAFTANNPIVFADYDGRDFTYTVSTVTNQDGTKTKVIHVSMTYRIVNISSKEVHQADFNTPEVKGQSIFDTKRFEASEELKKQGITNVVINFELNLKLAKTVDEVKPYENVLLVVDDVTGGDAIGRADDMGNVAAVEASYIGKPEFGSLVLHEIGHNIGLSHRAGEHNLMAPALEHGNKAYNVPEADKQEIDNWYKFSTKPDGKHSWGSNDAVPSARKFAGNWTKHNSERARTTKITF